MTIDSSGRYTLPNGYVVNGGDIVLPSQHNPPLQDIELALNQVLWRDGRSPMAGNLQMGGNKLTGLADGTAVGDALNVKQGQLNSLGMAVTVTGSANDIVLGFSPTITANATNGEIVWRSTGANTGAATIKSDAALAAVPLENPIGPLSAGDTGIAGTINRARFNGVKYILDSSKAISDSDLSTKLLQPFATRPPNLISTPDVQNPLSGFGRDIPAGITELTTGPEYLLSPSGTHFITFDRLNSGTAIWRHTRVSDNFQAIQNGGIAGSGTENTPGGSGCQAAARTEPNCDIGTVTADDETENEVRGACNFGLTPNINAPVQPSTMWRPSSYKVAAVWRYSKWIASRYRGTANGGLPGALNDSLANSYGSRLITMDNVGTDSAPTIINQVATLEMSYARTDERELSVLVSHTGYHLRSVMNTFQTCDPRSGGTLAAIYPVQQNASLTVNAISTVNIPVASLVAGLVVTNPTGTTTTLANGMKILLRVQTLGTENGIVNITAGGPAYDVTGASQVQSAFGTYTRVAANTWNRTFNYSGLPIIFSSADGTKAYCDFCPNVPYDGEGGNTVLATGSAKYVCYDVGAVNGQVSWEVNFTKAQGSTGYMVGVEPRNSRHHLILGTTAEVVAKIILLHNFYKFMTPNVFIWTFWRDKNLHLTGKTEDQVRDDWMRHGADTGRPGKLGQSIPGGWVGTARNYWRSVG
jgi:hypothetical protein